MNELQKQLLKEAVRLVGRKEVQSYAVRLAKLSIQDNRSPNVASKLVLASRKLLGRKHPKHPLIKRLNAQYC
jgi:hypothetical protein